MPRERNREVIRQWNLVQEISASTYGRTIAELATQFGVHTRTIRRDLEALQKAGFPLYDDETDSGTRWKINREVFKGLVEAGLTLPELCALYFSRTLLAYLAGTPYEADLKSGFGKIEKALSPRLRKYLDRLPGMLTAKQQPIKKREPKHAEILARLTSAILEQRKVSMRYNSFNSRRVNDYIVEPYRLAYAEGGLYLFAFVPAYHEMRTFAVERIERLSPLDERFSPVQQLPPEPFGDSLGVNSGTPERVVIEFQPAAAPHVLERQWHRTQVVKQRPDGSVVLTIQVCLDFALRAWILSFGPLAHVVEPKALAERIYEQLEEAREHYAPRIDFDLAEPATPARAVRTARLPFARLPRSRPPHTSRRPS